MTSMDAAVHLVALVRLYCGSDQSSSLPPTHKPLRVLHASTSDGKHSIIQRSFKNISRVLVLRHNFLKGISISASVFA